MGSEVIAEMFGALACSERKEIIIFTMHYICSPEHTNLKKIVPCWKE